MTTALASTDTDQRRSVDGAPRHARDRAASKVLLSRATAEGTFSLFDAEPVTIAAEKGLVIRVHSGCLWVPDCDEHCSVGVSDGDQFACKRDETLRVLGCRGTEVELQWPARNRASNSVH